MGRIRVLGATMLLLVVAASPVLAQGRGQEKQQEKKQQQEDRKQQRDDDKNKRQVSAQEQQQRAQQEQQRAAQYRQRLDEQVRVAQQQAAQLQEQKRIAQARAQEQYAANLRQQQERLRDSRDYSRDPYVNTPHSYRYMVGGTARQTNQYGAQVLRQAVNSGYEQGFRTGEADRQDGRRASYQSSFGYRDANYGYGGNYIDQSDYNYYFRQGFRRGYDDGYRQQSQYGTNTNGTATILGTLLNSILGLQTIR